MLKRIILLLAATSVAPLMAQVSGPQYPAVRCEGCTSEQMATAALQATDRNVVVFSASTQVAKQYVVHHDREPGYNTSEAIEVQLSAANAAAFSDLVLLHQATNGTMKAAESIPADQIGLPGLGGATVFDVMSDNNLRDQIGFRLPQIDRGWTGAFANVAGAAAGFFSQYPEASVTITILFADGSKMAYILTAQNSYGDSARAIFIQGTARDSANNVLPSGADAAAQGTYRGDQRDITNIADYLEDRGARIDWDFIRVIDRCSGGDGMMRCTWDYRNGHLNCGNARERGGECER